MVKLKELLHQAISATVILIEWFSFWRVTQKEQNHGACEMKLTSLILNKLTAGSLRRSNKRPQLTLLSALFVTNGNNCQFGCIHLGDDGSEPTGTSGSSQAFKLSHIHMFLKDKVWKQSCCSALYFASTLTSSSLALINCKSTLNCYRLAVTERVTTHCWSSIDYHCVVTLLWATLKGLETSSGSSCSAFTNIMKINVYSKYIS